MCLQFITPWQDSHRIWIADPSRIVVNYLHGWFIIDLGAGCDNSQFIPS
jgi:hypothetical protein